MATIRPKNSQEQFVRNLTDCQPRLYAFILSLLPNRDDASDVLQDTNLVIWRRSAEFTDGTNFVAWAYKDQEVRFGIADSALFATVTTDASCGANIAQHDSFTPLGGLVPLVNIMLSETVFGGVGAGLYGILIYVVLAVFIAGLMVGRTPEYEGKKIEAYDVKMAMLVTLVFPLIILALTGISSVAVLAPRASAMRGRTASLKSSTPLHRWRGTTAPRSEA